MSSERDGRNRLSMELWNPICVKGNVMVKTAKTVRAGKRGTGNLRWTGKKAAIMFWDWFLAANEIPKRDFMKELKREGDPAKALERLFAKMNKLAAIRQKLRSSGKWRRTR